MGAGRHRATGRRKRRLLLCLGAVVAVVATGGAASALFTGKDQPSAAPDEPTAEQQVTPVEPAPTTSPPTTTRTHPERASRDRERQALDPEPEVHSGSSFSAEPIPTDPRYLTEDLNLWSGPGEDTTLLKDVADQANKLSESTGKFKVVEWDASRGAFPADKPYALAHWAKDAGHRQLCGDLSGEAVIDFVKKYPASDTQEPGAA